MEQVLSRAGLNIYTSPHGTAFGYIISANMLKTNYFISIYWLLVIGSKKCRVKR